MSKKEKPKSSNPLASTFSQRLVELRKAKQLSQYDLADELGVGRTQISHWESGKNNPTLETIERLANYFEVPALSLLETEEAMQSNGRSSRLDQQVKRIKSLSTHKQRMITNMLEAALNTH